MRVVDYRPAIDRVLKHYGLMPESLKLVPDVQDWCEENCPDTTEVSGSRPAIFIRSKTGVFHIVMRETLSRQTFAGLKYVMRRRGFGDQVKMLRSERLCLLHLLLHEIAGYVLDATDQDPRDTWAFQEMTNHSYF